MSPLKWWRRRKKRPEFDAKVTELHFDEALGLKLKMEHPGIAMLAAELGKFVKDLGAENYVEIQMLDRETCELFAVTVQRHGKRTPHMMRQAAEAERDALKARLIELQDRHAALHARVSSGAPRAEREETGK